MPYCEEGADAARVGIAAVVPATAAAVRINDLRFIWFKLFISVVNVLRVIKIGFSCQYL
jgi:hypothetical protein